MANLSTPGPSPRDAACIARDFGIGLVAAGAFVVLWTFGLAPVIGFIGKEELKRGQRKAFYWGLGLAVVYTLIMLPRPCDLTDPPASPELMFDPRR